MDSSFSGGDSSAAVPHFDLHVRSVNQRRAHDQAPRVEFVVHSCRKGVEHQVQHDLLELNAVALDRQDRRREVELDGDPVPDRVAVDDALNRADHVVEIDVGKARRVALSMSRIA